MAYFRFLTEFEWIRTRLEKCGLGDLNPSVNAAYKNLAALCMAEPIDSHLETWTR